MRRILQGVLGVLLASVVLGLTRPATAQAPAPPATPAPTENGQPAPLPVPPSSPDVWENQLRLPTVVPAKRQPARSSSKSSDAPTKWGESAMTWESQVQKKPEKTAEPADKPATKHKPTAFASEHQPISSENGSASAPSPALTVPTTPIRWQRPVISEESEPLAEPPTKPTKTETKLPAKAETKLPKPATAPVAAPAPVVQPAPPGDSSSAGRVTTSATPRAVPLDRPFRWPPAYDVRPPEPKDGHPGFITFEDEPDPKSARPPDPKSAMMANLKQQVQQVCGKQARGVSVEEQQDGRVMVKVKLANPSNEDRLMRKILTIPAMTSPKVRLTMDSIP